LFEHEGEEFTEEVQKFKIMFLDGHLDIQTYELAHVSVSERIFSSEDWADFEDSLEVAHNTHLLIQLWGLGQTCLFAEISQTENIGSTFG